MSQPSSDPGVLNIPVPPRSEEAEQAVLGGMLLEPLLVIPRIRTILSPNDFYGEAHRQLYLCLLAMSDAGQPIDPVTVQARLVERDILDQLGGLPYIAHLLNAVPTAASAERYARIVVDRARLRRLHELAQRTIAAADDPTTAPNDLIGALRADLDAMAQTEAADTLGAVRCAEFLATDLPSPLWICEPLMPGGGLTFLFSQAGLGKSILACELARCVAVGQPFLGRFAVCSGPAIYLNLEMAAPQLQHRLRRFETHHPVGAAALYLCNEPLALNEPTSFARFQALVKYIEPALVVVDPLIAALLGVDENAATEIRQALSPAADLAREHGFALLVVHHSRKDAGRAGLNSLAGTRDYAARADVALLMQPVSDDGDQSGLLRVTCVKSRWGETVPPFCVRIQDDSGGNPALLPAESPNARAEVLEILAMQSPLKTAAILSELEGVKTRFQVARALTDLRETGQVVRLKKGLWGLPETGLGAPPGDTE